MSAPTVVKGQKKGGRYELLAIDAVDAAMKCHFGLRELAHTHSRHVQSKWTCLWAHWTAGGWGGGWWTDRAGMRRGRDGLDTLGTVGASFGHHCMDSLVTSLDSAGQEGQSLRVVLRR